MYPVSIVKSTINHIIIIDVPRFTIASQDEQAAVAIRENISQVRIGWRVLRSVKLCLEGDGRGGYPF